MGREEKKKTANTKEKEKVKVTRDRRGRKGRESGWGKDEECTEGETKEELMESVESGRV